MIECMMMDMLQAEYKAPIFWPIAYPILKMKFTRIKPL